MKTITINNFIPILDMLRICNNGYITNGHWAVKKEFMPKSFNNKIEEITNKNIPDIESILSSIRYEKFYRVFPVNLKDLKKEDLKTIVYQPVDKSFQVGFDFDYILWLEKNINGLEIFSIDNKRPSKLIKKGFQNIEIGLLMPKRF